jgi:ketosteroid isomerase-like protein
VSPDVNTKTVDLLYDAFTRGDIAAILDRVADDVDWATETTSTTAPWWGVRRGRDAVAAFFTDLAGAVEVLEFTPLVQAATDDEVLTVVRFRARMTATGRDVDMDLHHRWTFRDGQVVRYRGTEDLLQTVAALAP